ncbi:MAG: hypothetical protein ACOVNY_04210 [Chitinophagaceae bacterium]
MKALQSTSAKLNGLFTNHFVEIFSADLKHKKVVVVKGYKILFNNLISFIKQSIKNLRTENKNSMY